MRALAQASTTTSAVAAGEARGDAYLTDLLTFFVAGATAHTVTPVTINFSFHGTQSGAGQYDYYTAISDLQLGGMGITFSRFKSYPSGTPDFSVNGANWSNFEVIGGGDSYTAVATFNLVGAQTHYNLSSRLQSLSEGNATSDFSNTSSIRFILPQTVSMTSQSGVFLSQVAAVPEPGTWAMLIVGFGAVGGLARSSRRRQTAGAAT